MHGFSPESPPLTRVISWNLLRRVGARVEDVAGLVRSHRPDLLLLQEATEDIESLPELVGGHFHRHGMAKRIYGLAAWSPEPFDPTLALRLPASVIPGRVPDLWAMPRACRLVRTRSSPCTLYAKFRVLAADADDGNVRFEFLQNPNCGNRALEVEDE